MKRLVSLAACVLLASTHGAFADIFCCDAELVASIRREIEVSAMVRSKSESVANVCKSRRRLLKNIVGKERRGTVAQAINLYMQKCRLHVGDFEIVQLRRSGNLEQLVQNAKAIRRAYGIILAEVGGETSDAKKGKKAKEVEEPEESLSSAERPGKKWSGTRPNRQNMTQRGRYSRP